MICGLIVIALGALVLAMLKWRAERQQEPHFTYAQLHESLRKRDAQAPQHAVLLLGDSHIQALCEACLGRPALNFGIGGDTVAGLARRVADYGAAREPGNVAIVEVGANDVLWYDAAAAVKAFPALLDALRALERVYVYAVFPIAESAKVAARNAGIADTNHAIERACAQRPNCVFVDMKTMHNERGYLHENLHSGDGIHLSAAGYAVWLQSLREKLAPARE